jgi:hypothetical protein
MENCESLIISGGVVVVDGEPGKGRWANSACGAPPEVLPGSLFFGPRFLLMANCESLTLLGRPIQVVADPAAMRPARKPSGNADWAGVLSAYFIDIHPTLHRG